MDARIGVFKDFAEENGFLDLFERMWNTHVVFFVTEFGPAMEGWESFSHLAGSEEEAISKCTRGDGYYQIVQVHEMRCQQYRVRTQELINREDVVAKIEQEDRDREIQEWAEKLAAFIARYGRNMTEYESWLFCPAFIRTDQPIGRNEEELQQIVETINQVFASGGDHVFKN